MKKQMIMVFALCASVCHVMADSKKVINEAIKGGQFEAARNFLQNIDLEPDSVNKLFITLMKQFKNKVSVDEFDTAYRCVEILLKRGADPNVACYCEETPIFFAMYYHYQIYRSQGQLLHSMLNIQSEPFNIVDPFGFDIMDDSERRSLIIAQICKLIDLLVLYGASPNWGDDEDNAILSALDYACRYTDAPEVVLCLLRHGACANDFNEHAVFLHDLNKKDCEDHFNSCSISYVMADLKIKMIRKLLQLVDQSDMSSLSREKQKEVDGFHRAWQLKLSRLEQIKDHLVSYGACALPNHVRIYFSEDLEMRSFLSGVLAEKFCDLFELWDSGDEVFSYFIDEQKN